jgi:hypothetical protein
MRKVFRIIKNELSEEGAKAFHPLWYKIEQRHTLLFFIHWWGTPSFEPPHVFENDCAAVKKIMKHYPDAIVYDYYSENKCKK